MYSLIKRLRTMSNMGWHPIGNEAADEIERLQAENVRLKNIIYLTVDIYEVPEEDYNFVRELVEEIWKSNDN